MTRFAGDGLSRPLVRAPRRRHIAERHRAARGQARRAIDRFERKARSKTSLQALEKLAVEENGSYRIRSDPPVLFPLRDLPAEYDPAVARGRRPRRVRRLQGHRSPTIDAASSTASRPSTSA